MPSPLPVRARWIHPLWGVARSPSGIAWKSSAVARRSRPDYRAPFFRSWRKKGLSKEFQESWVTNHGFQADVGDREEVPSIPANDPCRLKDKY
jgi:hypothetical protein